MRELKPWQRLVRIAQRIYGALFRGMTLGASVLALDDRNRVFLVRHSYAPGFHLPGGGVERGETAAEAARREIFEEGRLVSDAAPELIGFFYNPRHSVRNHVALYLLRDVRQTEVKLPDHEIVESGFFALDALPADSTPSTRARLAEFFDRQTPSPHW